MTQHWKSEAADGLPIVQVSLALHGAVLADRSVSLFKNVPGLRVDEPADRSAGCVYVHDTSLNFADLLCSGGAEKHVGIFGVRSDENGIALNLFEGFSFSGVRPGLHLPIWQIDEGHVGCDDDSYGSIGSLHFSVQMIGEHDDAFHLHWEVTLRRLLRKCDLRFYTFNRSQSGLAAYRCYNLRGQGFALVIRRSWHGTLFLFRCLFRAGWRRNGDVDLLHGAERRERFVKLLCVADNQHRQLVAVDVLRGDAIHVYRRYLLNFGRVFVQPV